MSQLKIGDTVVRTKLKKVGMDDYHGMRIGDRDEVVGYEPGNITLAKYGAGHSESCLHVVDGPAPVTEEWSWVKADKLQAAAYAAAKAYNDYVEQKPDKYYSTIYIPDQK